MSAKSTILAQLSDIHIGANWEEGVDPLARFERAIEAVRGLPSAVDGVLVSGDLTDHGSEEEYRQARSLLESFDCPVHVMPGNHDDRAVLRDVFQLPGDGADPIDYCFEVAALRVVVLDSIVPGQDPGGFEPAQLEWLEVRLGEEGKRPTILALHHSPVPTGLPDWDAVNLARSEREALAEVVARHPQLRVIVGGHLHRIATAGLGGCPVLSVPSTYLQAFPDFESTEFEDEEMELVATQGFALHVLLDGEISSQVEMLSA